MAIRGLWMTALAAALLTPMPDTAVGSMASQDRKPDFSSVRTRAAAQALAARGELTRVLMFPSELGGEDVPENISYITPEAAAAKDMVTGTLIRFTREGTIDQLTVTPEYKGDSVVPSRIVMHATSSKGKGSFSPVIEVW